MSALPLSSTQNHEVVAIITNKENSAVNKVLISNNFFKVFIFVKYADEKSILDIISKVGVGTIGDYKECSFSSDAVAHIKTTNRIEYWAGKNIETVVTIDKIFTLVKELQEMASKTLCIYTIVATIELPKSKL